MSLSWAHTSAKTRHPRAHPNMRRLGQTDRHNIVLLKYSIIAYTCPSIRQSSDACKCASMHINGDTRCANYAHT